MAVTVSELVSNGSTTNTTNYATAAINPTANTLVLLAVHTTQGSSTDPVVPTVATAGGLTWIEIGNTLTQNSGTLRGRLTLFRSMASSPSSSAVTIQHSATVTGCKWSITQWSGVDTTGTNGSGAIAQAAVFNRADASTTVTMTLGVGVTAGNVVYGAGGFLGTMTWEEEAGWTELPATEVSIATPDAKLGGAYRLDAVDSSFTITAGASTEPGGVIVEIKAAAAATASLIWPPAMTPPIAYLR